jgi:putative component of toxin-antitoxin plasmid stabilization module
MKKLLGIVVLGLLICENVFAGVEEVLKEIKKNKDIVQGFDKVKEFDTWNEWRVTPKAILKSDKSKRQHIVKIVNKSDNHPVRFGKQSLRFEVRNGDGWGWDARNDRERSELLICCVNKKTTWTAWSLYLPNDYEKIFPAKTMLAQFHNDADNPPAFAFDNQSERHVNEGGGYWIAVDEYINKKFLLKKLLDHSETLGRWNDILVNAKWTHKENGFFKIWINGKLAFHHKGMTQEKGENIEFHVGIYRSFLSRTPGPDKTQIAYYDEIRHAKTCKKLKINDLGYSCKDIENQN